MEKAHHGTSSGFAELAFVLLGIFTIFKALDQLSTLVPLLSYMASFQLERSELNILFTDLAPRFAISLIYLGTGTLLVVKRRKIVHSLSLETDTPSIPAFLLAKLLLSLLGICFLIVGGADLAARCFRVQQVSHQSYGWVGNAIKTAAGIYLILANEFIAKSIIAGKQKSEHHSDTRN